MSLATAVILLAILWCIIHAVYFLGTRKPSTFLLPTPLGASLGRHVVKVSLKSLHLQISTTKWNSYHDSLSASLSKSRGRKISLILRWIYNLGTVFGALGMLMSFLILLWTVWEFFPQKSDDGVASGIHSIARRRVELDVGLQSAVKEPSPRIAGLTAIIPGLTVPLSDLPIIVVAVFFSQIIHELGHAIAAVRECLPLINTGVSFTVFIPAAFVTFSTLGMKSLSAGARSRIIAAGPYHNLIFWFFLVLITRSGIVVPLSWLSGYKNISNIGKVVIDVNLDSPLSLHLSPGSIIGNIDDISLSNAPANFWTDYLTGTIDELSLGWCVKRTALAKSDACCESGISKPSPLACFVAHDHAESGCIDPVPIMTIPRQSRCASSADCHSENICAIPHKESLLLRLTVYPSPERTQETIVLWNGSPKEIWNDVQVGNWLPKISILPLWFPHLLETFWEYLMMSMLSLYLFNLLPLYHLDGIELLHSLLDMALETKEEVLYDVEALEVSGDDQRSSRRHERWKKRITKYAPIVTLVMAMYSIARVVLNAII